MTLAKTIIICFISLCAFCTGLFSQSLPQIYVHTDRDIYFPGDNIWYKVYILREGKLDPTVRNVYIGWANEDGKVIRSTVTLAADGIAVGSFDFAHDSKTNYLQLNAYTEPLANNREFGYYRAIAVAQRNGVDKKEESVPLYPSNLHKGIISIIQDDSEQVFVILNSTADKDVTVKAKINNSELFQTNLHLKEGKNVKIPIDKTDLPEGLLQVRLYDSNYMELDRVTALIGLEDLIIKPELKVSYQNLSIILPEDEVASLSLAVVQPELPFDTVHTIYNDLFFNTLSTNYYPINPTDLTTRINDIVWKWNDIPHNLTASNTEEMLILQSRITMNRSNKNKFLARLSKLKASGTFVRGVSVASQANNEADPKYGLYAINENLEIKMPDMTFFGDLYLKTRMADPELDKIPFKTEYMFRPIPSPELIYKPEWENFSISKELKSKWLPIYDDYVSHLTNLIDTVSVAGRKNLNLVRKYDAINGNLNDESEIIDPRQDNSAIKYGYTVEQYLPFMKTRIGTLANFKNRIAFFLNSRQVEYDEVKDLFISNMAYVRVYHNPRRIPGYVPRVGDNLLAGVQLVELPPDEIRKVQAVDEKIEGYVDLKSFDQIGKMTVWWNPFLIVNSSAGPTQIILPIDLKGKRITIQGVTLSGKLVYLSKIIE